MKWFPIRKQDVVNHFRYEFWRYLVVVALAVAGWSMIFGFSQPQVSPQDKVDIKVVGYLQQDEIVRTFGERMLPDFPQLKQINFDYLERIDSEDYDGYTRYALVISTNQGDVLIVDTEDYAGLALDGYLVPLDDALQQGKLEPLSDQEREKALQPFSGTTLEHIYGIPLADLQPGFEEWGYVVRGKMMVLRDTSENQDNAIAVMQWLQQYMAGKK